MHLKRASSTFSVELGAKMTNDQFPNDQLMIKIPILKRSPGAGLDRYSKGFTRTGQVLGLGHGSFLGH